MMDPLWSSYKMLLLALSDKEWVLIATPGVGQCGPTIHRHLNRNLLAQESLLGVYLGKLFIDLTIILGHVLPPILELVLLSYLVELELVRDGS